jgi:hypothetical protein
VRELTLEFYLERSFVMLEEKQLFTVLSNDDLEQISGGFNPVKYGKYVINEFVKGFRQAW